MIIRKAEEKDIPRILKLLEHEFTGAKEIAIFKTGVTL